ncbi:MAG: MFS transporter [Alphaproteobacteria bacterium]|nr:MFS transporter [Alphaproteobacteria bacterium]
MNHKDRKHLFTASILSLSLLTVMAGAAVAPALNVIAAYFTDAPKLLIQLIISVPALFIVLANMVFPWLCTRFRTRTLVMIGLILYTVGGCAAGVFNNIYMVLFARALVGIGVGIIMPMSTGLLTYYYTRDRHDKLLGLSSAMNQVGGVVATLLSGVLSTISWRASFLVYLIGLVSIIMCAAFMPNERMVPTDHNVNVPHPSIGATMRKYYGFIVAMFLLMFVFFIYPCNFAIIAAHDAVIPHNYIAPIMAGMDLVAFVGGMSYVIIKHKIGNSVRFVAPMLFLGGYCVLVSSPGWFATIVGSAMIGFANGIGIPFIISTAAGIAGRGAMTTVMPLLSAALYMSQFLTPFILSSITHMFGFVEFVHMPYIIAIICAATFVLWSNRLRFANMY